MSLRCIALLCCLTVLSAFNAALAPRSAAARGRQISMMPSEATIAKKAQVVEEVVTMMEDAMLMYCVRSEGIKVNEINMLRQKFPEEVKIRCVKNTLVARAAEQVPKFQGGDELLEKSNYWFFVPETHLREGVDTWNDWVKETKKEDNAIVGGIFEGATIDPAGIEALTKLPTKQELMGTMAALLKAMPTKVARGVKGAGAERIARALKEAQGQKLGRAVNAMKDKL